MSLFFRIVSDIFIILTSVLKSLVYVSVRKLYDFWSPTYKDLSNDVVLITGAGNGLGRLLCLEFAKYCSTIVGWDVDKKSLEETARILNAKCSVILHTYTCDLRSQSELCETAERVLREVGRVTVLVNNAGVVSGKRIIDSCHTNFEDTFQVNVLSHFNMVKAFLPAMIGSSEQTDVSRDEREHVPRGHIVTIASIAAFVPAPGLADYCSSKAAVLMMSDALELELKDSNMENLIHVTRVCPFFLNTHMFEGCQSPLTWLFPTVDSEHCASQIVKAVRTNQRLVFVPRWQCLLPVVYRLLPTDTIHALFDLVGMNQFASQLLSCRENRATEQAS